MNLGHKQKGIIKLGKKKGFVTSDDATKFWFRRNEMVEKMNTLVMLGFFKKEKNKGTKVVWEYNDDR